MPLTPYQSHKRKWMDCQKCCLCKGRRVVVFARGSIPCDVLFAGDAPGESEDAVGRPFAGPAGALLDQIVAKAWMPFEDPENVTAGRPFAFYNLVGCFPREAKKGLDHRPPEEAIVACSARFQQFVAIAKPKLIVCVGKTAETWLRQGYKNSIALPPGVKLAAVEHPASIIRLDSTKKQNAIKACIEAIVDAVARINEPDDIPL